MKDAHGGINQVQLKLSNIYTSLQSLKGFPDFPLITIDLILNIAFEEVLPSFTGLFLWEQIFFWQDTRIGEYLRNGDNFRILHKGGVTMLLSLFATLFSPYKSPRYFLWTMLSLSRSIMSAYSSRNSISVSIYSSNTNTLIFWLSLSTPMMNLPNSSKFCW